MSEPVPATPAPAAAAPGTTANVITTPSTVPQAVPEGKVTIDTKEYAQLQRDAARGRSAQQRAALGSRTPAAPTGDANVDQVIQEANARALEAEKRAMQAEIRSEVSVLLEKEEFKALPKIAKDLILKNPSTLSSAATKEEALLDIEDYVREQVGLMGTPAATVTQPAGAQAPQGVETPPATGSGAPAPASAHEPEDLSKLRGPARSQAAIRNALKGVKNAA